MIGQFENHKKGVCSYAITGPNDLVNEFFTLEQIVLDDGTNNAAAQLRLLQRLDRNAFNLISRARRTTRRTDIQLWYTFGKCPLLINKIVVIQNGRYRETTVILFKMAVLEIKMTVIKISRSF